MDAELFGYKVALYPRKAKHFLAIQGVYRDLIRVSSEIEFIQNEIKTNPTQQKVEKAVSLMQKYEVDSLFYQIVVVSDSLKRGRKWWKFWRWNLYRKFEQSYIKNNIDVVKLAELTEKVGKLEGNKGSGDNPGEYIPLDEMRVKAFVHRWAGIPYEKVTEQDMIDFFDSIQFAGEMLRIQIEGGKINLTKEDEMSFHMNQIRKAKERGWLGKNSTLIPKA